MLREESERKHKYTIKNVYPIFFRNFQFNLQIKKIDCTKFMKIKMFYEIMDNNDN
jgi:hypothetical protein